MEDKFININVFDWKENKKINICIMTVIFEEISEVIKKYNLGSKKDTYMYWEGHLKEYPNICVHCYQLNESGNVHSVQLTQYVLEKEYDYYFFIGTAGAVNAQLYDVVIANQIIYLEKGANTTTGRLYDGKAPEITEKEKNTINTFLTELTLTKKYDFVTVSAPIYSGENVEKNPQVDELKEGSKFSRHLAAIDMESFGVFQALNFCESFSNKKCKLFIIRGISDKADDAKNLTYEDGLNPEERKKRAMRNVVEVVNELILFLKD